MVSTHLPILLWILVSFLFGFIGEERGLKYWKTFLISLFLTPIVGYIYIHKNGTKQQIVKQTNQNIKKKKHVPTWKCPECGEENPRGTHICSSCGNDLMA